MHVCIFCRSCVKVGTKHKHISSNLTIIFEIEPNVISHMILPEKNYSLCGWEDNDTSDENVKIFNLWVFLKWPYFISLELIFHMIML